MNKNYISLLLILFITIGMGSYVYYKKFRHVAEEILMVDIIPQNITNEIIDINNPSKILEELFNSNLIWKGINDNSKLKKIEVFWNQSDSIFNVIKNDALTLMTFVNEKSKEDYFILEFKEEPIEYNFDVWNSKNIGKSILISKSDDFSFFNKINEEKTIVSDNNFETIYNTKSHGNGKINIFQKNENIWSVFDLSFLPEQIFTNGFEGNTSQKELLKSTIDLSVLSFIPSKFESIKLIHFDSTNQLRKDEKYLSSKKQSCNCDIEYSAYSWIESPSVFFKSQYQSASYILFKLTSILDFKDNLNSILPDSLVKEENDNLVIRRFNNSFDFNSIFKTNMKFNYFVRVDDYVMFSEDKLHLERLLFQQKSNSTIDNNLELHSLLKNSINNNSNEVVISGGLNYWNFKMKNGITIEQSHVESKELIYNSVLYTQELNLDGGKTNPKWNIEFSSPLYNKIYVVNNHRTNDKDYIVQDRKNTLYFITPNGEIKWKKSLDNPVVGKIKNIDILGNNKYQLIFNTKNKLYILDILGRNVTNFPVSILDSATANVSIIDYDKDLNFRFLIPTTKGIKSIDKNGLIVKGWGQPTQKGIVERDINHLLINNLDYLQVQDNKGNLYFYNRRGEVRHEVSSTFNGDLYILNGSSIEQTRAIYFDSVTNTIKKQFFSSKKASIILNPNNTINEFFFLDIDSDNSKDFILIFENEIKIYGQDLILKQNIEIPSVINQFNIWNGGYGLLNQFGDVTITRGQNVNVIENATGYRIDFYKEKIRAIVNGENNLKLIHI